MVLIYCAVIFIMTYLCIRVFIRFAKRIGFENLPNERSMHTKSKARGAGTCFVGISLVALGLVFYYDIFNLGDYFFIFIAISLVFIAGILDDLKEVSPKVKFSFIILASLIVIIYNFYISTLGSYFNYSIHLPFYVGAPFTVFAITGFTNALNLTDGLDGLAGMISIIMLSVFLWIGFNHHDDLMIVLSSFFIAAVSAFLLFNWYPAKVFMGDSGSLTLGFVISILGIRALDYVQPLSILFIVVLPVLDTFIVMTRRIQRGISPFKPDKTHMHHILYNRYEDVSYVVIMLIYIQMAFTIIGVQLRDADNFLSLILFGILFFIFLNLFDQRMKHRKIRNKAIIDDWSLEKRKRHNSRNEEIDNNE